MAGKNIRKGEEAAFDINFDIEIGEKLYQGTGEYVVHFTTEKDDNGLDGMYYEEHFVKEVFDTEAGVLTVNLNDEKKLSATSLIEIEKENSLFTEEVINLAIAIAIDGFVDGKNVDDYADAIPIEGAELAEENLWHAVKLNEKIKLTAEVTGIAKQLFKNRISKLVFPFSISYLFVKGELVDKATMEGLVRKFATKDEGEIEVFNKHFALIAKNHKAKQEEIALREGVEKTTKSKKPKTPTQK